MRPYLINLTRQNEIGANSYYLNLDGHGVLLDAGMHPKLEGTASLPNLSLLKELDLHSILITHAHYDHTGSLPRILLEKPEAPAFMTEPTYHLTDTLLHNSVNIMKKHRTQKNILEYPLYTHNDINQTKSNWQPCHMGQHYTLDGYPTEFSKKQTSFQFHHAGHILGSAAVQIHHPECNILYTGDINFSDQTLIPAAKLPTEGIHTLIIETTRGDTPTPPGHSRPKLVQELVSLINQTFENNGAVLIPVFAMGKTQELLTELYLQQRNGNLQPAPILIGGLSKTFTQTYDSLSDTTPRNYPELQLLDTVQPQVVTGRAIGELQPQPRHIYLLSSGMMTQHTLSNILAQKILSQENHAIIFIGYADPDSPGGQLKTLKQGESMTLDPSRGPQRLRCRTHILDFTSHALREDILNYILTVQPKQCMLVHGDPSATEWFRGELEKASIQTLIPAPAQKIAL